MKVFVFTYDRYDTITTSGLLEAEHIDHVVLCHTDEQHDAFAAAGRVAPGRIVATGASKGLANNRNEALDRMDDGEWAIFLVDDLMRVTELDTYDDEADENLPIEMVNAKAWQERFSTPSTLAHFLDRASETITEAERLGANLVGFAGINNSLFRRRHYALNVLADGRAWAVRKTHLRFDPQAQMIDDLCWTALNIRTFGVVVVNLWVLPHCRRYTKGGYGSIDARMEQKLREAAYLCEAYPELITTKAKAGWPDGSHVVLRRATPQRQRG